MKITIRNFQIANVIALCNAIYPQRMLIGDKLKIKENAERLIKKQTTIDELKNEIILSNGGTESDGIKPDHENYNKAIAEITDLLNLEVEISITPIALSVLERLEAGDNVDLDAVLILAGTYVLPVKENSVHDSTGREEDFEEMRENNGKEVELVPSVD